MKIRFLILFLCCISCDKEAYKKPSFVSFQLEKDSIFVNLTNKAIFPIFIKIEDRINQKERFIDFKKGESETILKFSQAKIDTNLILKNYKFSVFHGPSNLKRYDTFYNYGLPFLKGKRYKVLQGNNSNFTHNKASSKYAIDFKMNVGQEICAIREGIVVNTRDNFEKNGRGEKFRNKANLILVHHKDGTFVQYGHLKKDGVLVKIGDAINKGQVIGYSGNTGMSTEPHLHFTVYKPTKNGLVSIPYILDSIPSERYKKGKFAVHN